MLAQCRLGRGAAMRRAGEKAGENKWHQATRQLNTIILSPQSNMGYGMCGALSPLQSPLEAMNSLPPIRFFFNHGSGPGGGSPTAHCSGPGAGTYHTPNRSWFTANQQPNNTGGASAICMLTAGYLYDHFNGTVPVGAVEACQSATNVQPWTPTPPNSMAEDGELYTAYIKPLTPMQFAAVLWDQVGLNAAPEIDAIGLFDTLVSRNYSTHNTPCSSLFSHTSCQFLLGICVCCFTHCISSLHAFPPRARPTPSVPTAATTPTSSPS
jgi:hypothetical protein